MDLKGARLMSCLSTNERAGSTPNTHTHKRVFFINFLQNPVPLNNNVYEISVSAITSEKNSPMEKRWKRRDTFQLIDEFHLSFLHPVILEEPSLTQRTFWEQSPADPHFNGKEREEKGSNYGLMDSPLCLSGRCSAIYVQLALNALNTWTWKLNIIVTRPDEMQSRLDTRSARLEEALILFSPAVFYRTMPVLRRAAQPNSLQLEPMQPNSSNLSRCKSMNPLE
jgi:hypothetical protein